jgi:coenzyme Q-binding protein COQ10
MVMGTSLINQRFTTKALLVRPHRVEISSHDHTFECFEQLWTFKPVRDGGTDVKYQVDIRFRSRVFQVLVGASFSDRSKAMMEAYIRRAKQLYGSTTQGT